LIGAIPSKGAKTRGSKAVTATGTHSLNHQQPIITISPNVRHPSEPNPFIGLEAKVVAINASDPNNSPIHCFRVTIAVMDPWHQRVKAP
jgi:hypothetical protein